jgi:hypothetical protein
VLRAPVDVTAQFPRHTLAKVVKAAVESIAVRTLQSSAEKWPQCLPVKEASVLQPKLPTPAGLGSMTIEHTTL